MIFFLCCLLQLDQNGPRRVELLDLSSRTIFSAATVEGRTLLATMRGAANPAHWLFDHSDEDVFAIEDGRIPQRAITEIIAMDGGFALIDRLSLTVVFLDAQGLFSRREDTRDYEGLPPEVRAIEIAPYRRNQALVTCLARETGLLELMLLDLGAKRFEHWTRRESDEMTSNAFWCWDGERLYFVRPITGRIDQIDPESFRIQKVVRTARKPVTNPFFKPGNLDALPLTRYLRLLTNPVYLPGRIKFEERIFASEESRNEEVSLALLSGGTFELQKQSRYLVAEDAGKQLWFDKESGDFEVVDTE